MIQRLRFDKYSALYLWALFMIVFTITEGTTFLSWTSAKLVFTDPAVYTGTLALAFLVPLATGTYDLADRRPDVVGARRLRHAREQRHDAGHRRRWSSPSAPARSPGSSPGSSSSS